MKFKQIENITVIAIMKAQGDTNCDEFVEEFGMFLAYKAMHLRCSGDHAKVQLADIEHLFERHPKWRDFLEEHKFIEREFEPFDVTIRIESEDDARMLKHDLDHSRRAQSYPSEPIRSPLYVQACDQLKARGIEV